MTLIDLTEKRFGRLTVLRRDLARNVGGAHWACSCDCGVEITALSSNLRSGDIRSCGCFRREEARRRRLKHGAKSRGRVTPEWRAWQLMIRRCCSRSNKAYQNYGGRGIKVCDRWRANFQAFLDDVGPRPSPHHSLDRYPDNDGDYEPTNVRWATHTQQQRNKRRTAIISLDGVTMALIEAIEQRGLSYRCVYSRLRDRGYELHAALELNPLQTVVWVRRLPPRPAVEALKISARRKLRNAVRRGQIERGACERCGNAKSQAHHLDYSKPLEVRWLCSAHHAVAHRRGTP